MSAVDHYRWVVGLVDGVVSWVRREKDKGRRWGDAAVAGAYQVAGQVQVAVEGGR